VLLLLHFWSGAILLKKFLELAPICRLRFEVVLVGIADVPPSQLRFKVEGVWRDS